MLQIKFQASYQAVSDFSPSRFRSFRRSSLWSRHRNYGDVVCFYDALCGRAYARVVALYFENREMHSVCISFFKDANATYHIYYDCRRTAVLNLVCEQSRLRSNLLFSERCLPVLFNNYVSLQRAGLFLALKYPIVLFHSNRF